MQIERLFHVMVEQEAADLFLKVGNPPLSAHQRRRARARVRGFGGYADGARAHPRGAH